MHSQYAYFLILQLARESSVDSVLAISFICSSPSSHLTLLVFISFKTSDERLDFNSFSDSEIKDNKDFRTLIVAACTALKMLRVAPMSLSLLEDLIKLFFVVFFS